MRTASLIIILIIALAADAVTGMSAVVSTTTAITGCDNPTSLLQCGKATCQFGAGAPLDCVKTVTFPKAFSKAPKNVTAQITGWTFADGSTGSLGFGEPVGGMVAESDNGTIWRNMPATLTELYGNVKHEVSFPFSTGIQAAGVILGVTILNASISSNAILEVQWSTDDATWHTVTGSSVDVSSNSFCGVLPPPIICAVTSVGGTVQNPLASWLWRIVGVNGNGAGDMPIFNNIQIFISYSLDITPIICIPLSTGCPNSNVIPTATSFVLDIEINVPEAQLVMTSPPLVTVNWYAWQ